MPPETTRIAALATGFALCCTGLAFAPGPAVADTEAAHRHRCVSKKEFRNLHDGQRFRKVRRIIDAERLQVVLYEDRAVYDFKYCPRPKQRVARLSFRVNDDHRPTRLFGKRIARR